MKINNFLSSVASVAISLSTFQITAQDRDFVAHNFNDGDIEPFEVCTTKDPNYARVINNRMVTYWTERGYDGGRVSKGAEFCFPEFVSLKETWMGWTMNIDPGHRNDSQSGVMQIFQFVDNLDIFTWTGMLLYKYGDLEVVHRSGKNEASKVYGTVMADAPRGEDIDIIVHYVLSGRGEGLIEFWINGRKTYTVYDINFGFGSWNNDVQYDDTYVELKLGQYDYQDDEYNTNEERVIYYDNVTWYNGGSEGYDRVNPSDDDSNPEPEVDFTPDPNKTYYLDVPEHNVRLAANGSSEDPYTTSTNTTGANVEWQFTQAGDRWYLRRAAGGARPGLRTDNSASADMQETSSSGGWTKYAISDGASAGTYFLTVANGPADYKRLQIDRDLNINMVADNRNGTWESFRITEAGTAAGDARYEAEDYDGMSGIQTETSSESGENVGWIHNGDWLRFDDVNLSGLSNMDARVAGAFTGGTIQVRTGSANGTLIGSINVGNTGGNQSWTTINTSLSSVSGTQDVFLMFTGGAGYLFNVNWIEFNSGSRANKSIGTIAANDIHIFPNLVNSTTTIQGAANSTITLYDMTGRVVFSKAVLSESENISLSHLTAGIYYAEVLASGTRKVVKLVKN